MCEYTINITVSEYESADELAEKFRELVIRARQIAQSAYIPYSGFGVGAALLLEDGAIITGNNQENAAYPSGNCAERIALYYANSQFPEKSVIALAISGIDKNGERVELPIYPCGACRQVMLETETRFGNKIKLFFDGKSRIQSVGSAREILPLSFDKNALFPVSH
ncbi:MAG: cytidine deaminase [Marinilabiliales bacterium]|nr:MAG: cytidine deaminase [Marinilabiliales bacterium]